jgi:hypothetical protein
VRHLNTHSSKEILKYISRTAFQHENNLKFPASCIDLDIPSIVGITRDNNARSHIFRFDKVNEGELYVLHTGLKYSSPYFFKYKMDHAGFEVLTAVVMKSSILWDIKPFSPLKNKRRFGEIFPLYLQGLRMSQAKKNS